MVVGEGGVRKVTALNLIKEGTWGGGGGRGDTVCTVFLNIV